MRTAARTPLEESSGVRICPYSLRGGRCTWRPQSLQESANRRVVPYEGTIRGRVMAGSRDGNERLVA
jgi:hypothetical protein